MVLVWATLPSVTKIAFIGKTQSDYAISIEIEGTDQIIWTTQDLVEFISHGEGMVIEIGNKRATRNADGSWKEEPLTRPKRNLHGSNGYLEKNKQQ